MVCRFVHIALFLQCFAIFKTDILEKMSDDDDKSNAVSGTL